MTSRCGFYSAGVVSTWQVGAASTLTDSSFPANEDEMVARCVEEVMPRGGVLTAAREEIQKDCSG